jgi:hypothetical protein
MFRLLKIFVIGDIYQATLPFPKVIRWPLFIGGGVPWFATYGKDTWKKYVGDTRVTGEIACG